MQVNRQTSFFTQIDMVDGEETRWKSFNPEIPQRGGKIYDLEKFDATFFGVHFKQAHTLDPQCRILMEVAYEAILDAGVNPKSLRGTRTGVYVGGCISESEVSLNEYCSKDLDETGNKIHGLQSFEVFSLLFFVISVFLYIITFTENMVLRKNFHWRIWYYRVI